MILFEGGEEGGGGGGRVVDEDAIRLDAERKLELERADRKAQANLKKAARAEEANFEQQMVPIRQKAAAAAAIENVKQTIAVFKNAAKRVNPPSTPTK